MSPKNVEIINLILFPWGIQPLISDFFLKLLEQNQFTTVALQKKKIDPTSYVDFLVSTLFSHQIDTTVWVDADQTPSLVALDNLRDAAVLSLAEMQLVPAWW